MLFDLKGRRRRVVQVTYVGLAILMGGGLVLFGIGSSGTGGILDAITGGGSGGSTSDVQKTFNKRIAAADAALARNPKDQAALAEEIRSHFALAGVTTDATTGAYTTEGKAELTKAGDSWENLIAQDPNNIDSGLVRTAYQIYAADGLNQPSKQLKPAQLIAADENTSEAYVTLVGVATLAGDTRTAGLAEKKAIALAATKDDKANVKEQIATVKAQVQAAQQQQQQQQSGAQPSGGG
jgi:hypothetical protein